MQNDKLPLLKFKNIAILSALCLSLLVFVSWSRETLKIQYLKNICQPLVSKDWQTVGFVHRRVNSATNQFKPPAGFIRLTFPYSRFDQFLRMGRFRKFRFFPYQQDANDDVRLFTLARKTLDNSTGSSNTLGMFNIDKNGISPGENPNDLPSAIKHPPLSLTRSEIETLLVKLSMKTVTTVELQPTTVTWQGRVYNSYNVIFDGSDTGVDLNPSPPFFTSKTLKNKK